MAKHIKLNFTDLNEETQQTLMQLAESEVLHDADALNDIKAMFPDDISQGVREYAERKLYEFEYEFNV